MDIRVVLLVIFIIAAIGLAAFFLARRNNRLSHRLGTTKESYTTDIDEGTQGSTSGIPFAAPSDVDEESMFVDSLTDVPINAPGDADEESVGDTSFTWSLPIADSQSKISDGEISIDDSFELARNIYRTKDDEISEFTRNSYRTKDDEISEFTRDSYRTKDDEISEFTRDSYWTKDDENSVSEFEIKAPAGMLGVVLETTDGGVPKVQEIKSHGLLAGQVRVGDQLVAVDGRNVSSWNAAAVSRLIASKKHNPVRELIFARQKNY